MIASLYCFLRKHNKKTHYVPWKTEGPRHHPRKPDNHLVLPCEAWGITFPASKSERVSSLAGKKVFLDEVFSYK